jgi:hypothetical protein
MTFNVLPAATGEVAAAGTHDNGAANRVASWSFSRVGARERPLVERFIRFGFERAYGARLVRLMPALMALRREGDTVAACGLRAADGEKLFLEAYLDQPIEVVLSRAAEMSLGRADIVEVGNLVISRAGFARSLIVHLTAHLHATGPAWVVFTAVPALRNNFKRLGVPLVTLAAADGNRLPSAARAEWGDYYRQTPMVTAVRVEAAFNAVCGAACTR